MKPMEVVLEAAERYLELFGYGGLSYEEVLEMSRARRGRFTSRSLTLQGHDLMRALREVERWTGGR